MSGDDHAAGAESSGTKQKHQEWLKEMRGWLMVLATLAASVAYQAGLNPPGGFWQDDDKDKGRVAGNPVLRDLNAARYLTFHYLNATAFATSLVIILLLLNEQVYQTEAKVAALILTTMVDLMSLVGAYIAGSTRDMPSSIYIIVLTCFLFVVVVYMARVLPNLCFIVLYMAPPLLTLANKGWLPVTANMRKRVEEAAKQQEEQEREKSDSKIRQRDRCLCCACFRAPKHANDQETEA